MNMRPAPHRPSVGGLAAPRLVLVVVLTSLVTIGASATIPGIIGPLVMSGPTAGGPQPRGPAVSAVPTQINHQGVVAVNGQRFNGNADFKFALVDPGASPPATETYLWTNDGSHLDMPPVTPPDAPTAAVNLPVIDGLFNVRLGESPTMDPIPASVFNDNDVVLRVWFNDGVLGEQKLSPDQVLTSVPYAMSAATSPPIGSIIAWHKSFGGGVVPPLPDGWLECNGQTVTDVGSPLNSQTLPDLNGQARFLRGSTTSGDPQDDATALPNNAFTTNTSGAHNHNDGVFDRLVKFDSMCTTDGGVDNVVAGQEPNLCDTRMILTAGDHSHTVTGGGDAETRPINMSVVWIMRVK